MPEYNAGEIRNIQLNGLTGVILDQYTPIIGGDAFDLYHGLPRWLPAHHRRRIKAYQYLDQIYSLVDRPSEIQEGMDPVRLGSVPYAVQVLRDLTIGETQNIVVKGAAEEDAATPLVKQQELMNDWAVRNFFLPKIQKGEELTACCGDIFYKLWIGATDGEPDVKIDVIHPSFVFPNFTRDGSIDQVTLLWEEYRAVRGIDVLMIYKDIYEIGKDGYVRETAGWYQYATTPSLDDLKIQDYDVTDDGRVINQLNLGVKQIPIYHLPNFWTHYNYGESDLCYLIDASKEINASDTDLAAAARISGLPPLVVSGLKARIKAGDVQATSIETIGPGKILNVDANGGKAEYLDNSHMLDCLIKYADRLEDKFFRNIRLGKLFAGKTDNIRDIESQKAFKTLMATLYARVGQKRSVRMPFYSRLLRGVREMLILIGSAAEYPEQSLRLELGNILPLDNSDDIAMIAGAWQQGKGFLSAQTAAKMGSKAGTGVVDFKKEADLVLAQLSAGKTALGAPGAKPFSLSKTPAKS